MNLIRDIKSTGLDIFVQYHPRVLQLKRQAKSLHKDSKKLSLMQCQEIVAKQAGFNNWHHFMQIIKKHYEQDLDNRLFSVTKEPIHDSEHILMGHDVNFNNYKWHDQSSMRTHHFIVGQSLLESYDLFLMKQLIAQGQSVLFINPTDEKSINELVSCAQEHNRQGDIKIFNFGSANPNWSQYETMFNSSFSHLVSFQIINLLTTLISGAEGEQNAKKSQLIELFVTTVKTLEKEGVLHLSIEEMIKMLEQEEYFHSQLKRLNSTDIQLMLASHHEISLHNRGNDSQWNIICGEIADQLRSNLINVGLLDAMKQLIKMPCFSATGMPLHELINRDKHSIKIIRFAGLSEDTRIRLQKFIISIIRNHVMDLLSVDLSKTPPLLPGQISKMNKYYIFARECALPKGTSVMAAQSRSAGVSLTWSFSSFETAQKLLKEETIFLMSNAVTHILCPQAKEVYNQNFKEELEKIHDVHGIKVSPVIASTPQKDFLYFQPQEYKKPVFWVLKRGQEYLMEIN